MSKNIFFILSSLLLITIIYCSGNCTDKYPYDFESPYGDDDPFTDGDTRKVWNHAHSCETLQVPTTNFDNPFCCYIHIEYESTVTGERHDKYGCIDVEMPFEDYGGNITNVENRVTYIENKLKNLTIQGSSDGSRIVSDDHLHVKIVCSANFSKLSLFTLLILILF